jgi:hypothetical protein
MALVVAIAVGSLLLEASPGAALTCGAWRWPVKTLSDTAASRVDYTPKATTSEHLRTLSPPGSLGETTPRRNRSSTRAGGSERSSLQPSWKTITTTTSLSGSEQSDEDDDRRVPSHALRRRPEFE